MRLEELPFIMIKALMLTILIEISVSLILGYRKKDLINILLVNVITNPLVTSIPVYFNIKFGILERNISLLVLELLTIIIEGFIYSKFIKKRNINPYLLSLILNLSSYLIGVLINGSF